MGFICLFFPAIIFCAVRGKFEKKDMRNDVNTVLYILLEYVCGNILINSLIILGRLVLMKKSGNIYESITSYNDFAIKYLALSVLLAVILPYLERYIRDNIVFKLELSISDFKLKNSYKTLATVALAFFFMGLNFLRMFDNSVSGDEGIVVGFVRGTWLDMLKGVAGYGHSPFHQAFAWICVKLFGESGFVFHFSASLPYFIIIFLSATVIRKWFGNKTAVILMTFGSLLDCAIIYNMEIRMYTWCELFIFLAFLMLYKIYSTQELKYYVLMAIFGAAGAYSHYFALASIGIMYGILCIYTVVKKKNRMIPAFLSGLSTLELIVPWMLYAKSVKGVVISDYNMGQVSWSDCFEFIFHSKISWQLFYSFIFILIILLLYEFCVLKIEKTENGKYNVNVGGIEFKGFSNEWIWILSGIIAVFGTVTAAKLISYILYPIICLRYLYVSYIIIWLLMGVMVSKLKFSRVWTVLLVLAVFVTCYPSLIGTIKTERENNRRLESTLSKTQTEIAADDFIYTDIVHFAWTVATAYYPNVPHDLFGHDEWGGQHDLTELDPDEQYWLFLSTPISETVQEDLNSQGKYADIVVDNGYIGTGNVWIYKVMDQK